MEKEKEGEEKDKLGFKTKESGDASGGRKKEAKGKEREVGEKGEGDTFIFSKRLFQTKSRHTVKWRSGACAWLAAQEEGGKRQAQTEIG